MVSVNYPILAESYEEAVRELKYSKETYSSDIDTDGRFVLKRKHGRNMIYLWYFTGPSLPASNALLRDFSLCHLNVPMDKILLPVKDFRVVIYLHLVPNSVFVEVQESIKESVSKLTGALEKIVSELCSVALDVTRSLQWVAEPTYPMEIIDVGEFACNKVIYEQIATVARQKGFYVATNKCEAGRSGQEEVSKYFFSRPDLVLYNKSTLQAAVLIEKNADEDNDNEIVCRILVGGVTGN